MPKQRFHREKEPTARPTDLVIRSNLPQWVVRVLRESGVKRLSMIAVLSDQQLLEVPGIGRRSLALIRDEIRRMTEVNEQPRRNIERLSLDTNTTNKILASQDRNS